MYKHKLSDFPACISQAQLELLSQERHVRLLQEAIAQRQADIENAVAFDASLTNDAKRKARKAELMATDEYQQWQQDLQIAQDKRTELQIGLELLRNQFTVLKLERREAIAHLEVAA